MIKKLEQVFTPSFLQSPHVSHPQAEQSQDSEKSAVMHASR